MTRVLLVGEIMRNNVGWSFATLLPAMGRQVVVVNDRNFFVCDTLTLPTRVLARVSTPLQTLRYAAALRRVARRTQPDLVLVLKGSRLRRSMLEAIRCSTGAPIINYTLDDYFPLNSRAIPESMRECIPAYDLIATSKGYNVPELLAAGARRALYVRSAYDPRAHHPVQPTALDRQRFGADVLFVGTYERDRAAMLETLAGQVDARIAVYGNGWQAIPPSSPLYPFVQRRPLYGPNKLLAFASCTIALCFLRKANRDTYTDRSFEIPATGAFMLAERSSEHTLLFEEGEEIACFGSADELVQKVRYYLAHDHERARIAAAGHRRLLTGHHTYQDRLREILAAARSLC